MRRNIYSFIMLRYAVPAVFIVLLADWSNMVTI